MCIILDAEGWSVFKEFEIYLSDCDNIYLSKPIKSSFQNPFNFVILPRVGMYVSLCIFMLMKSEEFFKGFEIC